MGYLGINHVSPGVHTLELRDVLAARRRLGLSFKSTGVEMSVRYSVAFTEALRNDSATRVGWIPF